MSIPSEGNLIKLTPQFLSVYLANAHMRIVRNWTAPAGSEGIKATVRFVMQTSGMPKDIKIAESSGNEDFDLNAMDAVKRAASFGLIGTLLSFDVTFSSTSVTVRLSPRAQSKSNESDAAV